MLECLHLNKAVLEFPTDVQMENVKPTMLAMVIYATSSAPSIPTVPEERSVWQACVSRFVDQTRIVSRVRFV